MDKQAIDFAVKVMLHMIRHVLSSYTRKVVKTFYAGLLRGDYPQEGVNGHGSYMQL